MINNQFDNLSKKYQEEMMNLYNRRHPNNTPKIPQQPRNNMSNGKNKALSPTPTSSQTKPIPPETISNDVTTTSQPINNNTNTKEVQSRLPTAPPPKSQFNQTTKAVLATPQNPPDNSTPPLPNNNTPIEEKYPIPILPYFIYEQPNPVYPSPQDTATGFLKVEVSSAESAIPIEGVSVIVSQPRNSMSSVIVAILYTNENGETDTVSLPAPPIELSESPNNPRPFSTYNISAYKNGFFEVQNLNVPIFAETTSVQPINLIPVPAVQENDTQSIIFPITPPDL